MPGEIHILISRYLDNTISPEEQERLDSLLAGGEHDEIISALLSEDFYRNNYLLPEFAAVRERNYTVLCNKLKIDNRHATLTPLLKAAWFRYAAIIVLTVGLGTVAYLLTTYQKNAPALASKKPLRTDIAPGGDKAVLTLANGKKIILDNAANGNLAQQGGAQVVKMADGRIAYKVKGVSGGKVMWNTMATPVGGQYQVILPDETKVWLNAMSSITYPTVFDGGKREVSISGEAYFEVAKNTQKPFIVNIGGRSSVEVLGTSFNINSYENENSIKTTLLSGSIRMTRYNQRTILKPGQQAIIAFGFRAQDAGEITVIQGINTDQALAWKNGFFNFNGLDLQAVMRQLERWYDIKVDYRRPVDKDVFKGRIYRRVNLADVLDILEEVGGVKFELEGKTLVVL